MIHKCDQCGESFTENRNLTRHIQSKHADVKYSCDKCNFQATRKDSLKGSCHGQLSFHMLKSLFCWAQRHNFCPDPWCLTPSKEEKTKNPGTSSAPKSGYPEENRALKTGYPEENVALKNGYRKRIVHWKLATGKILYCFLVNCLMDL